MSRSPIEHLNLADLDAVPGSDLPSLPKRTVLYLDLTSFGTFASSGPARPIPVRCRKRPARKGCRGLLVVRRRDLPATIEWTCPVCAARGEITGWENHDADLRDAERPHPKTELQPVPISIEAHAALRDLAHRNTDLTALAFGATVEGELAILHASHADRLRFATELLVAALHEPNRTRSDRVTEVAAALGGLSDASIEENSAGNEAAMLGVLASGAATELLSLLEQEMGVDTLGLPDLLADQPAQPSQPAQRAQRTPRRRGGRRRRSSGRTYEIKVTLQEVKPPVWRRLLVPGDIGLEDLHRVIQTAMGWLDYHLHSFSVGRRAFSPRNPNFETPGEDTAGVTLLDLAPLKGDRVTYEYDFGDCWLHDILVERVLDEPCEAVECVRGKRACPPEDCGGAPGYRDLLDALADPNHEDHERFSQWIGTDLEPERFDVRATNAALAPFRW